MIGGGALSCRLEQCAAALARALAERIIAHEGRGVALEFAGGCRVCLATDHPLNGIRGVGLGAVPTDREWQDAEQTFVDLGAAPRVDLCPFVDPRFQQLILVRGFALHGFESVRYRWIERGELFSDRIRGGGPLVVRIEPNEAAELEAWNEVMADARGGSTGEAPTVCGRSEIWRELPDAALFLALIDGRAVGASAMWVHEGVAIMSGCGVRPDARGLGVHSKLLRARLGLAQERGCDVAEFCCIPGSIAEHNAQKFGFDLAYTRATVIKPSAGSARAAA